MKALPERRQRVLDVADQVAVGRVALPPEVGVGRELALGEDPIGTEVVAAGGGPVVEPLLERRGAVEVGAVRRFRGGARAHGVAQLEVAAQQLVELGLAQS
jgi:hypothetical protein